MREVHVFAEEGSARLHWLQQTAPFISRKLDCDPANNPGGLCFNCPQERSLHFELAAKQVGLDFAWGVLPIEADESIVQYLC
jgi:hypothetical protein